jgi:hypothetical protein
MRPMCRQECWGGPPWSSWGLRRLQPPAAGLWQRPAGSKQLHQEWSVIWVHHAMSWHPLMVDWLATVQAVQLQAELGCQLCVKHCLPGPQRPSLPVAVLAAACADAVAVGAGIHPTAATPTGASATYRVANRPYLDTCVLTSPPNSPLQQAPAQ